MRERFLHTVQLAFPVFHMANPPLKPDRKIDY